MHFALKRLGAQGIELGLSHGFTSMGWPDPGASLWAQCEAGRESAGILEGLFGWQNPAQTCESDFG
jgi:hypothetical protein